MGLRSFVTGKMRAATRLLEFMRYVRNWSEVWCAFRARRPLPPLILRGGLRLEGGPEDDWYGIFHEVFVRRCYTHGFYTPACEHTVVDVGANIGVFALFLSWSAPAFAFIALNRSPLHVTSLK